MLTCTFFSYCKYLSSPSALEHAAAWGILTSFDSLLSSLHLNIKELLFSAIWYWPERSLNVKNNLDLVLIPEYFISCIVWYRSTNEYTSTSNNPHISVPIRSTSLCFSYLKSALELLHAKGWSLLTRSLLPM